MIFLNANNSNNKMRQLFLMSSFLLFVVLMLSIQLAVSAPVLPPLNSTNTGKQITGKFIWFELASINHTKHKTFYGDVFGWTFKTISSSDDQYTLIKNNGRNIAGLFNVKPSGDSKPGGLWIGLMSVADPAEAVKIVKAGGGSVHTPPTTIANRGSYALFVDPEGAMFGVLKSSSGDPVDEEVKTGEFIWMDLFAANRARVAAFYQPLADFKIEQNQITKDILRLVLKSSGKARAGIVPLPEGANRSGWLPYIKVDDIDQILKKVEAAGGYVMVSPDKDLSDGNLAIFRDPLGGMMGIVKWDKATVTDK
jgi:predicted enzyme related to lactoylglutathione lyase